jgi:actin-related protein
MGWMPSFAGNSDPSFVFPTAIATRGTSGGGSASGPSITGRPSIPSKPGALSASSNIATKRGIDDLDFFIGDEAIANSKTYNVNYPIRHGQIEDWDLMERFWQQTIFKYLRAEPEDHHVLLVGLLAQILLDRFFLPAHFSSLLPVYIDGATDECTREPRANCGNHV